MPIKSNNSFCIICLRKQNTGNAKPIFALNMDMNHDGWLLNAGKARFCRIQNTGTVHERQR
jgi:hypothetical protein